MPKVKALDHLVLTIADLEATVEFYVHLGMVHEEFEANDGSSRHALSFGAQKINLHLAGGLFEPHALNPVQGSADLCLITDDPLATWEDHLAGLGIVVELGPVDRTGATGPLRSIYLRDPDGNLIEISEKV